MVAHAGGWDELLIALLPVFGFLTYRTLRGRREAGVRTPQSGPCLYCGRALRPGEKRCSGCGFKARGAGVAGTTD